MAPIMLLYDLSNNSDNRVLLKIWNAKLSFNKSITMTKKKKRK